MISISDDIKTAYFKSTKQIDRIILDNTPYYITNVEYSDNCYQDGNVFGTAEARQLEFEIENSINLENKEYEYQTGIEINGEISWISLGKFITYDVSEDDISGITKVNAMDYMIKSNILYDHSSIDFSLGPTIKEVLEDALEQAGLELGTETFVNSTFIVYSDQFEDNALIRNVIIACAQISGTFAKIRSDNKLYLINPNKFTYGDLATENSIEISTEDGKLILLEKKIDIDSETSSTELGLRDYSDNELKRNTHEINTLILGMANVEGENVVVQDEQMIIEDGTENKIVIYDNPFAYTQALRTQLITPIFEQIKGFSYTAFEMKYQGLPFLECGDKVIITTLDGNTIESYCFRYSFKSPNGLESTIQAPSLTDAEVKYENVENLDTRLKRTEIIVDKENQQITSIVEQIGDREGKTTTITQDIDHIESIVDDTIDLTREIENVNPITLENCRQGNLLELRIKGNNEVFKPLMPSNTLTPSDTLTPLSSQIEVHSEDLFEKTSTISSLYYVADMYFYTDISKIYGTLYKGTTTRTLRYLEVEPNKTYYLVIKKDYLPMASNMLFSCSTYNEDILDKLEQEQETYILGNSFDTNSSHDSSGWYYDTTKIVLSITTGENDKYLFFSYWGGNNKIAIYENYQLIDLDITTELKKSGDYYDEYVIKENKGYELRRIGEGGVVIENPEPTNVKDLTIPLAYGTNYIDILGYTANIYAKWVIFNELTNYFATELDLKSSITQSSNEIKLSVMEEVTDDFLARKTIESSIDLGILDDEGYIAMKTNKMSIDSDNFTLTTDGEIIAKKGNIART